MEKKLTFAKLGNQISKKLGYWEEMLKSTEPSDRNGAKRMIPKLKNAMQQLMQQQEIVKAENVKKDLMGLTAKHGPEAVMNAMGGQPAPQQTAQGMPPQGLPTQAYGGNLPSYQDGSDLPETEVIDSLPPEIINPTGTPQVTGPGPNYTMPQYVDNSDYLNQMGVVQTNASGDEVSAAPGYDASGDLSNIMGDNPSSYASGASGINWQDALYGGMSTAGIGANLAPGVAEYYNPTPNYYEPLAAQRMAEMERSLYEAQEAAKKKRDYKIRPELVENERAYQEQKKLAEEATGAERFRLASGARARKADKRTALTDKEQNIENQWNDPGQLAQLLSGIGSRFGNLGQMWQSMGEANRGENKFAALHRLMTDANLRNIKRQGLSDMSKYAQNQQLMGNQQGVDADTLAAMKQFWGDPNVQEWAGNLGGNSTSG